MKNYGGRKNFLVATDNFSKNGWKIPLSNKPAKIIRIRKSNK